MTPETSAPPLPSNARVGVAIVVPLVLLAIVIFAIVKFGPSEMLRDPDAPPVELLSVQRTLLKPEGIVLNVLNESPDPVTIAQVAIDDAYWRFNADGPLTVGRLRSVTLTIPYPWVTGEAHHIAILTTTGTKFEHEIAVALRSPEPDIRHLLLFAAIGVFVGVIPVALGLLWFPVIRRMGRTGLDVVLAFTVGLLLFLFVDATTKDWSRAGCCRRHIRASPCSSPRPPLPTPPSKCLARGSAVVVPIYARAPRRPDGCCRS